MQKNDLATSKLECQIGSQPDSDSQLLPSGEQELVISQEEYNRLHDAMNFLQKCLDEHSGKNAVTKGIEDSDFEANEGITVSKNDNCKTSNRHCDSVTVCKTEAKSCDKTGSGDNSEVLLGSSMTFPIHKADIEELKTHVFGWRRLCGSSSLPVLGIHESDLFPLRGTGHPAGSLPGVPITDGFSMMKGTIAKYGHLHGSMHNTTPLSANVLPSVTSAGSTLHDDIMKQSEMVLDIIKESGDIKEADIPPAVFHWQDVRNSIAHQLLNESHQKITTIPHCESTICRPKENKDAKLTSLLKELDIYLKDKEGDEKGTDNINTGDTGEKSKSKLPDSVRILMKAVEQELGASVNITIQGSDDQPVKLNLNCNVADTSGFGSEKYLDAEHLEERQDINKRKEKYKEEFDRINAEYEELRRKRLSLLVQAYTGKQDPRPLNSKANGTTTDTAETSKALALAKAAVFKSRSAEGVEKTLDRTLDYPRKVTENKSASEEYLASQTRVQRDLFALAQKENLLNADELNSFSPPVISDQSSAVSSPSSSHLRSPLVMESISRSKLNALLSSRDSRTISAISQDSQLIKERIQAVREQLSKAEQKHGRSLGYTSTYYDCVEDLADDEPVEDDLEEYSSYQSPSKLSKIRNKRINEVRRYPPASITKRVGTPRREIYPHKKTYEPSSAYWKRCCNENEDSIKAEDTFLNDVEVEVEAVRRLPYDSRHAPDQSLDEAWSDLGQEDYLAYPEHRRNSSTEPFQCNDDDLVSKRPDTNNYSITKDRLNRSLRQLHTYYREHDQSYNRREPARPDVNHDARDTLVENSKQSSKELILDEQLNRSVSFLNTSNSSVDHQSFHFQLGCRHDTISQDLPVDPCSALNQEKSHKSMKKTEKDVSSRRKLFRNEDGMNHYGHDENVDWKERSVHSEKEQTQAHSISFYGSQKNFKSGHAKEVQLSECGDLDPEISVQRRNEIQVHTSHEKHAIPPPTDKHHTISYLDHQLDADRKSDHCHGKAASLNENDSDATSYRVRHNNDRESLTDSILTLDDCNCIDMNSSIHSYPGSRIEDHEKSTEKKADDEVKYNSRHQFRDNLKNPTESRTKLSPLYDPALSDQEAAHGMNASGQGVQDNVTQTEVSSTPLMMEGSRRSEDDESVATSDAELVVTKGGDILKRPRSTSPTHNVPLPREVSSPTETIQTKYQDQYLAGSHYDSTSHYCEATCKDSPSSRYLEQRDNNNMKWSEPKRHFGLRDTKMKGVTWADPTSCSSNTPYLKPLNEGMGMLSSSESCQQNKSILKPYKDPVDSNQEVTLTEEQRQYADELINQYTSNLEPDNHEQQNISHDES
ncbi:hypothetical protein LSH36_115g13078 [Paralvinella palmiformis]|uniref:Uncharacterized protein n=1 Tax=Paralvinella palmiformis TaxID=53620 RepID=A0AAD9N977_9ANNE|nr:hypothetical protein LSH36_115g13078 [Paralvinella palmiformis]